jgi:hypothetical protein
MEHSKYVSGLRAVADFLEAHPELGTPLEVSFSIFFHGEDAEAKAHAAMASHAFGRVDKSDFEEYLQLIARVSGFKFEMWYPRKALCRQVLVRTNSIPEQVIPALPERLIPAQEIPVYEWRCDPILASAGLEAK